MRASGSQPSPTPVENRSLDDLLHLIETINEARLNMDSLDEDFDPEKLEALVVGQTQQILGVEACSLFLFGTGGEPGYDDMLFKSSLGRNIPWSYLVFLEREASIIETCIASRTPLLLNDVSSRADFNARLDAPFDVNDEPVAVRSMLCVPLPVKGRAFGALQVVNKEHGEFTDYDLRLLTLEASALANIIYNSRLIQQLRIANAELEANRWRLLNSQNTLRALFDSIPSSIYIIDRKYQLIAVNMARAQKGGLNKPEDIAPLIGRSCYEALFQRDAPCPGCKVLETLYGNRSTNRTDRQWENEEEPTEWEISSYPILDEQGQAVQAILLEQNVTEKRRLEATLTQSEKLAAVGHLAAGVAHEINNPLTAILANAQLLQRQIASQPQVQDKQDVEESLDLILLASERAIHVVKNLLNFARKEKYELKPLDINENIRNSLSLLQHEITQRAIELVFEPAADLPIVVASANHLQGVWMNLIVNAMDSIENGQGSIRVSTFQSNNNIYVKVIDTGKGIPAERIQRIFEPFYTTKAPNRGTGLGLSVCHRIVKQHGGHILVDSQVDAGTEFTVVLPIVLPN